MLSISKEFMSRLSELVDIDEYPWYEHEESEDESGSEDDADALPIVNLLEQAKKLGRRLRKLKGVGDAQADRLRTDILLAVDGDPDEFDESTRSRGECTESQVEFFIEAWIAKDEERGEGDE